MELETIVIRKYGNRRLYDTNHSRYVNLEDIADLVREGKTVQVLDARTGQDLTRVTLTQIITEDAKGKPTGLPLELLRQLILASDQVGQEFVMWYLKSAFDTYQKVQDAVRNRLTEVESAILSPVDAMKKFLGTSAPVAPVETDSSELEAMRKRIAELEARIAKKASARKATRRQTRSKSTRRS
jgi:polyhydroxyalkanoate synthesis repressor PhaR